VLIAVLFAEVLREDAVLAGQTAQICFKPAASCVHLKARWHAERRSIVPIVPFVPVVDGSNLPEVCGETVADRPQEVEARAEGGPLVVRRTTLLATDWFNDDRLTTCCACSGCRTKLLDTDTGGTSEAVSRHCSAADDRIRFCRWWNQACSKVALIAALHSVRAMRLQVLARLAK
jgi:hypothetical protein